MLKTTLSILIWRSPCQVVGAKLPYDTLAQLRRRMTEISPNLTRYGDVEAANYFAQAVELAKVSLFFDIWLKKPKSNFDSLRFVA